MKRFLPNPPQTKNPGALAGATGAPRHSADWQERSRPYPQGTQQTRRSYRVVTTTAGRFICLEVAHG